MRKSFGKSLVLGLVAGTALSMAAMAAETPETTPAAGNGVTFVNGSSRQLVFYTRFGSEASCQSLPKAQTVSIAPNQTVTVDSGGSKVCFCLQVPERRGCPSGWSEVKAGGTRRLG
jgi:ABC-type phosphate transport system substrate-binding protein